MTRRIFLTAAVLLTALTLTLLIRTALGHPGPLINP